MADPTSQEIDDYLASPTSADIDAYLASAPAAPAPASAPVVAPAVADQVYGELSGRLPAAAPALDPMIGAGQDASQRVQRGALASIGQIVQGAGRLADLRSRPEKDLARVFQADTRNPVSRGLTDIGQAMEGVAMDPLNTYIDPARDRTLVAKGAEIAGSVLPMMATGMATAPVVGAVAGGLQMGEQGARQAEAEGRNVERALLVNTLGGSALNMLPIPGVASASPAIDRLVTNELGRRALRTGVGTGMGALVNGVGDIALQVAEGSDLSRERMVQNAAMGAGAGFVAGAASPASPRPGVRTDIPEAGNRLADTVAPLPEVKAPELVAGERAPGAPSPLEAAPTAMEQVRREAVASMEPEYQAVVQKYPDLMAVEGLEDGRSIPVEIRHADGTTEGAVMNGYGDALAESYGEPGDIVTKPSIGYYKPEAGGFSHTPIRRGDTIVSKVPTPEEWRARAVSPAEAVYLDPASPRWLTTARETAEQVINVPATLRAIEKLGQTSPDAAVDMIGQMHRQISERNEARRLLSPGDRVRGADYVKERLLRARRTGELPEGTASFGLWLLDKNPAIADALGVSIRERSRGRSAAGQYTPGDRLVTLFTESANPGTAVHEILHHSERLMPKPVQEGILKEWSTAAKRAVESADDVRAKALLDFMAATQTGDEAAWNRANAAMGKGVLKSSDYQFTNPSEWWAVNGTKILSNRYGAQGWVASAKQWLMELLDQARGFFGGRTNAAVIKALRGVVDGTYKGEPARGSKMLSTQMVNYLDPAKPLKPLPEEAIVVPLGKREQVLQGVGGDEQWQVRLPGEKGRGRTVTAEKLAEMGYLPPEPKVDLSLGGGEPASVPLSQLPGAIQAALFDTPMGPRTPAMTARAMDQGGVPGGPVSPTAIVSGPAGPAPEMAKPLSLIESAKASPEIREDLKQGLGGFYTPITNAETVAKAAAAVDAYPTLDAALIDALKVDKPTAESNAMGLELVRKLQVENRLQDAADLIYTLATKAKTQGQAIQILATLAKSSPDAMLAYATKLFGRKLTAAEVGEINAGMKRIGAAKYDEVRVARTMDLLDRINSRSPLRAKWDEKASALLNIAMLLNPKTIIRNVLGNAVMASTTLAADAVVPIADMGASVFTGKRMARGPQALEYFKGLGKPIDDFRKGYAQARSEGAGGWESFKEGRDTAAAMGKLISGDRLDVAGVMSAYRSTFSHPLLKGLEKTMNLVMGGPDRAFYTARLKASLADQMKAAGAQVPTADMIDRASIEAARSVYQDKNFVSDALREVRGTLNSVSTVGRSRKFGAGQAIVPFVQVPGALLMRGLEYSPAGFLKAAAEAIGPVFSKKQFDQREFSQALGRAFAGTLGIAATGYWLSQLGIISGTKDEDPKVRNLQRSLGFGGYQVNVSALKRAFQSMDWRTPQSRQAGDVFYSYDWAQPVAFPAAMGASMAEAQRQARMSGDKGSLADRPSEVLVGLMSGARTLEEQPLLSGLSGFMQDVSNARQQGSGMIEALADSMLKLPGQFAPAAVRQVQQLMDNRVYETRGSDKLETAYQSTLANIPGLAQALGYKPRADVLGDLAERYQANGNTFFNVLVNPGFVTRMKSDPELRELYGIWETTGNTGQIPGQVDRQVTINGQPKVLTASERADYQQFVGRITRDVFKQVMRSDGYQSADDDVRAKVLAQIVSAANTVAKVRLFGDRPRRVDKYDRALFGASMVNPEAEALVPGVN